MSAGRLAGCPVAHRWEAAAAFDGGDVVDAHPARRPSAGSGLLVRQRLVVVRGGGALTRSSRMTRHAPYGAAVGGGAGRGKPQVTGLGVTARHWPDKWGYAC